MKFKVFISLLLVGCVILFGFVYIIIDIIQQEEDRKQLIDRFSSRNDSPPPDIPRTEKIPDDIRQKFAVVSEKPEIIAKLIQGSTPQTVEFSPTNSSLLVSRTHEMNTEKKIKLWDINNPGTPLAEFSGNSASFSPDGNMLAISDLVDNVKLWNIADVSLISSIPVLGSKVVYSPNGNHIAIETPSLELWDVSKPTNPVEFFKLRGNTVQKDHTFSPNGRLLATIDSINYIVNIREINGNQVINTTSIFLLDRQNSIDRKFGGIDALQFSADPKNPILAIVNNEGDIRLYNPPGWQNYNTIPAGNVFDFAFTPDGKVIISAGSNEIEFWSVENGKHITSIEGHSDWVKCIDVSADGRFVAGGGNDGVIRVWNIDDYLPTKQETIQNAVIPIYFLPTNRLPQAEIPEKIDILLSDLQTYFADEMERHGYGRKSFKYEKNSNGSAKVYLFEGKTADDYYDVYTTARVKKEIQEHFDLTHNFYFVIMDEKIEKKSDKNKYTVSDVENISKNIRDMERVIREMELLVKDNIIREYGGNIVVRTPLNKYSVHNIAAKFGKSIGLNRDYRSPSYLMSYSEESKQLSKSSAAWLNCSQYFNANRTFYDVKTSIKRLSNSKGKVRFKIEDTDGIRQVRLLVKPMSESPPAGFKRYSDPVENQKEWDKNYRGKNDVLHDVLTLKGEKKTTVEFDYPKYAENFIELKVIDVFGNRTYMYTQLVDRSGISFSSLIRRIFD